MARSESKALPKFKSLDKLVEFFDTHDMGEYWDQMSEADFDIKIKRRKHLVVIDEEIIPKLNEIAKSRRDGLFYIMLHTSSVESGGLSG